MTTYTYLIFPIDGGAIDELIKHIKNHDQILEPRLRETDQLPYLVLDCCNPNLDQTLKAFRRDDSIDAIVIPVSGHIAPF